MALGEDRQLRIWGWTCSDITSAPVHSGYFCAAVSREFGAGLIEGGGVLTWGQWQPHTRPHFRPSVGMSWSIAADEQTMYEIVGPPVAAPLRVQQTPSSTALIWRPFTRREVLEFTERLDPPQWRAVSGEPRRYNELRRLEIPPDAAAGYYRLVSP